MYLFFYSLCFVSNSKWIHDKICNIETEDLQMNEEMNSKIYKSIDEMVEYLYKSKKIIVDNEDKHYFSERNYISIINPYKQFFSTGRNNKGKLIYKKEHNFKELLKIVKIDDEFSKLMYEKIGLFEKKLKVIIFDEMCLKYINCEDCIKDKTCTVYLDEIKNFLENGNPCPRFCENYFYIYEKIAHNSTDKKNDTYNLERKRDLLEHIYQIGKGEHIDGSKLEEIEKCKNKLVLHYLSKNSKKVPLWIVPNALTLGELQTLFLILDTASQKRIVATMKNFDESKIDNKDIISFSGHIELIRQMRNIINHYEPLLPFLISEMTNKKIEDSKLFITFNLLDDEISKIEIPNLKANIDVNSVNSKSKRILDFMFQTIKENNTNSF